MFSEEHEEDVVATTYFLDQKWRNEALCKGFQTEDFFPERINKTNIKKVRTLIKMCLECPVRIQCLHEACVNDHDGIWAGYTYKERISLARSLGHKDVTEMTYAQCAEYVL